MTADDRRVASPARVLIVDDERKNRELLRIMLEPEGYLLLTAESGSEALGMIASQRPDLVLLDIMMPGMNGYVVTSRIKGDAAMQHIPVILLSALDDRSSRAHGLGAGADDFLTKPVDRTDLCAKVRAMLRRAPLDGASSVR